MCPFGLRSELIKEIYISHPQISYFNVLPPPLFHEAARTLKYLKGISVKNSYRAVTVGSSSRASIPGPRSHVTVMWSSLNNSCLWFQGKLGARFPLRWQQLTTPVIQMRCLHISSLWKHTPDLLSGLRCVKLLHHFVCQTLLCHSLSGGS